MNVTLQQTEKLFTVEDLNFNSLPFSMLVTRLKILHARAPLEHTLGECNAAINAFLEKFRDRMAGDFEIIAKL